MRLVRPVRWDEELALPPAPAGLVVRREETQVRLVSALPGRGVAAIALGVVAMLSIAALITALRAHPATMPALVAWWVVVPLSSLIAAIASPLAIGALLLRRLVVLTPGVLLVREGRGRIGAGASCLRTAVRAVETSGDGRASAALRVHAELSPTAARLLGVAGSDPTADAPGAVLQVCRGERPEVARFLGQVIADWADVPLEDRD
jgi:hypothetical protein